LFGKRVSRGYGGLLNRAVLSRQRATDEQRGTHTERERERERGRENGRIGMAGWTRRGIESDAQSERQTGNEGQDGTDKEGRGQTRGDRRGGLLYGVVSGHGYPVSTAAVMVIAPSRAIPLAPMQFSRSITPY